MVGLGAIIVSSTDSGRQLKVIQSQIDEMRAEQRPWVYADIRIGGEIYKNVSGTLTIPLEFTFRNAGHPPAQYVQLADDAQAIPSLVTSHAQDGPLQNEICSAAVGRLEHSSHRSGVTIFPGQSQSTTFRLMIPNWTDDWIKKVVSHRSQPGITILGCVVYMYGERAVGSTGFAALILGADPNSPDGTLPLPANPTTLSRDRLRLRHLALEDAWQAQ